MRTFDTIHAIITGGSSGIGKAIARMLAARGANVSIIARRPAVLAAARTEIAAVRRDPGRGVLALQADVARRQEVDAAVAKAVDALGPPDLVVTAAGWARPGYFQEIPIEVFEESMAVNYFGTLNTIRAALPSMLERRQGRLVLVSSGVGLVGIFGYTAYAPSKMAVRGLAESLRGELRPHGIGVSIVYPPDTDTPQLRQEAATKPRETSAISGTARTVSADDVARAVLRGVRRGTFAIAPGLEMTLLERLHSPLAGAIRWYTDRAVRRVQR